MVSLRPLAERRTTPTASSLAFRQQHAQHFGVGSSNSVVLPARSRVLNSRRLQSTMLLGGGAEELLMPAVGSAVSNAVVQAHAHLMGSGVGSLLLAVDEVKPPNIYGPIARGGLYIVIGSVVSAYMVSVVLFNLPIEDLQEINRGLEGGDQLGEIETRRIDLQARLQALSKDMDTNAEEEASSSVGAAESKEPLKKLVEKPVVTAKTAAVQADLASLDDEY